MGVHSHLIGYRLLGSMASLNAALIHLGQKRFRFSRPLFRSFVPEMMFGRRRGCVPIVLICLSLAWSPAVFSQEIDEGEFSRTMLGYKLQHLKAQFEQTEMRVLTGSVAGTTLKNLERVYSEIKRLEAEFRCGRYYPDLLDQQIVIICEELRLILCGSGQDHVHVRSGLSLAWINQISAWPLPRHPLVPIRRAGAPVLLRSIKNTVSRSRKSKLSFVGQSFFKLWNTSTSEKDLDIALSL